MYSTSEERGMLAKRLRGVRFTRSDFGERQKLNGVCFYLYDKGFKNAQDQHWVIKLYVVYMQWDIPAKKHVLRACVRIQEDFESFTVWFTMFHLPKNQDNVKEGSVFISSCSNDRK